MAKKVSVLLFVVALMIFTFSPGNELRFDQVGPAQGAMAQAGAQGDYGQGDLSAPVPTPTMVAPTPTVKPTPSPTPQPTPEPTPEPTPMVKGMSNPDVAKLQTRLIALGFLEGVADGAYGAGTVSAVNNVKQFLNDQFLKTAAAQPAVQTYYEEDDIDVTSSVLPTPQVQLPYTLDGQANAKLLDALYSDNFSNNFDVLAEGDKGSAVKRIQSRLTTLGYLYKGADGAFGPGTTEALSHFQKVNGLSSSGIADRNTQAVLFSDRAVKSDKPLHEYKVVVDVSDQRVSVYQWNESKEDYTKLVQKFKCSTGTRSTPTPKGTYDETVRRGSDWHYFKNFGCWAQYAIHIDPTGDVMFHSVIFNKKGGRPTSGSVSALGRRASHGCIRLSVANAKWLWENITDGTTVIIQ